MEMRIYIANLGKYNEGELVGAWFLPPVNMEEVAEKIGLNETYEEYAIHDYELPFDIGEYESIDEINRLCEMAEELLDIFPEDDLKEIENTFFTSLADFYEHKEDVIMHGDCDDMADVARKYLEENSLIPEHLKYYIDYEAYGRDLEYSGQFLVTSKCVYERI